MDRINTKKSSLPLVISRVQIDALGALLPTGTTTLRMMELQDDGTLKSLDFATNTFKSTVLTTATVNMVHQTTNNGTFSSGIWTYVVTTTGFTVGKIYIAQMSAATAIPIIDHEVFQWGGQDGDAVATKL